MSLISEERIKEIAWNDVEHAIRIAIRETAEACAKVADVMYRDKGRFAHDIMFDQGWAMAAELIETEIIRRISN